MVLTGVPVSVWAAEGETVWRTAIEVLNARRQKSESEVDEDGVQWGG